MTSRTGARLHQLLADCGILALDSERVRRHMTEKEEGQTLRPFYWLCGTYAWIPGNFYAGIGTVWVTVWAGNPDLTASPYGHTVGRIGTELMLFSILLWVSYLLSRGPRTWVTEQTPVDQIIRRIDGIPLHMPRRVAATVQYARMSAHLRSKMRDIHFQTAAWGGEVILWITGENPETLEREEVPICGWNSRGANLFPTCTAN